MKIFQTYKLWANAGGVVLAVLAVLWGSFRNRHKLATPDGPWEFAGMAIGVGLIAFGAGKGLTLIGIYG